MIKLQNNLTTGELSLQGINSSGQRIFEKSLTPYPANALIGTSSRTQMLAGDGAVSQVANKVAQVQNNRVPYKPVLTLPNYLSKPEQGGVMVVGAGTKAISGAYNIDINPKVGGVHYGNATNLVNVPTGSQSKVIIENPYGFEPLNPEILRVVKPGGEIRITGVISNSHFSQLYSKSRKTVKVPKGFELIENSEIPDNQKEQGYLNDGKTPIRKKTDKIIVIRKK